MNPRLSQYAAGRGFVAGRYYPEDSTIALDTNVFRAAERQLGGTYESRLRHTFLHEGGHAADVSRGRAPTEPSADAFADEFPARYAAGIGVPQRDDNVVGARRRIAELIEEKNRRVRAAAGEPAQPPSVLDRVARGIRTLFGAQ